MVHKWLIWTEEYPIQPNIWARMSSTPSRNLSALAKLLAEMENSFDDVQFVESRRLRCHTEHPAASQRQRREEK